MNKSIFERKAVLFSLPFLSAVLINIALFFSFASYIIFIAFVPFFVFLVVENKLKRLCFFSFFFHLSLLLIIGLFVGLDPVLCIIWGLFFLFFGLSVWALKKLFSRKILFISLPFLLLFFEIVRNWITYLPSYFLMTGYALGPTVFLPLAKIGGVWGLSFFVFCVNLFFVKVILDKNKKKYLFLNLIFVLCFLFLSFFILRISENKELKNNKNIAVFSLTEKFLSEKKTKSGQHNLPDNLESREMNEYLNGLFVRIEKVIPEKAEYVFFTGNFLGIDRKGEIENQAFSDFGISNNGSLIVMAKKIALATKKNVVIGMFTREDGKKYNSVLSFRKDGVLVDVYHKTDLVLGSEHWPFGDWVPFWYYWFKDIPKGQKVHLSSEFSRSETPFSILKYDDLNIGVLLCSEAQKSSNFKKLKNNNAQIVFASVNISWPRGWHHSFFQYLYLNSLRINSFYYDVPVVINGKRNYSGVIYPNGSHDIKENNDEEFFSIWSGELKY